MNEEQRQTGVDLALQQFKRLSPMEQIAFLLDLAEASRRNGDTSIERTALDVAKDIALRELPYNKGITLSNQHKCDVCNGTPSIIVDTLTDTSSCLNGQGAGLGQKWENKPDGVKYAG